MDAERFDALVKVVASRSRRGLLRLLAGGALGAVMGLRGPAAASATHFACVHVAKPCRRARQCCSGICRGPQGKKTCRAHGGGTCKQQGQELVCTAQDIALSRCDNEADCACVRTTAGSNYCAEFLCRSGDPVCSGCAACERDADCVRQGFPEGSACAPFTAGRCAGSCESGTFCAVPCGTNSGTPPPS